MNQYDFNDDSEEESYSNIMGDQESKVQAPLERSEFDIINGKMENTDIMSQMELDDEWLQLDV